MLARCWSYYLPGVYNCLSIETSPVEIQGLAIYHGQEEDLNVQEAVMDEDPSAFNIQASDQEETDPDDSEDEEISVNHASVGASLVEN